jgi:flagellar motility protein MotE (MotC chaperone)
MDLQMGQKSVTPQTDQKIGRASLGTYETGKLIDRKVSQDKTHLTRQDLVEIYERLRDLLQSRRGELKAAKKERKDLIREIRQLQGQSNQTGDE